MLQKAAHKAAVHGIVFGDPIRVGQILNNLLSNAVKFTEEGIISLRLFRRGDILRMEVEDRGVGSMAPSRLGKGLESGF